MSEREKKIIESIAAALPNMSEFSKGYMLGVAESRVTEGQRAEADRQQEPTTEGRG